MKASSKNIAQSKPKGQALQHCKAVYALALYIPSSGRSATAPDNSLSNNRPAHSINEHNRALRQRCRLNRNNAHTLQPRRKSAWKRTLRQHGLQYVRNRKNTLRRHFGTIFVRLDAIVLYGAALCDKARLTRNNAAIEEIGKAEGFGSCAGGGNHGGLALSHLEYGDACCDIG